MTGVAPDSATLTLGMVAGEASGDLLAASLLGGLAARVPRLDAAGIGGPAMARHGFDAWWTIEALSVNGYLEVLREYPRLRRMREALAARLIAWQPRVFVGVDAPDFNLDLEARLRRHGIRAVHFIGPSIWAWRRERIDKIRRSVDHMLLVFPFEETIYRDAGIPATYVGHPLADAIPSTATAPPRAERSACRRRARWSRCCRAAVRPRSSTWRYRSCEPRPRCTNGAATCTSCCRPHPPAVSR